MKAVLVGDTTIHAMKQLAALAPEIRHLFHLFEEALASEDFTTFDERMPEIMNAVFGRATMNGMTAQDWDQIYDWAHRTLDGAVEMHRSRVITDLAKPWRSPQDPQEP